MSNLPIITILTFLPLIGGVIVVGLGKENGKLARGLALTFSFLSLALALGMWKAFDASSGAFQFEEKHAWIPSLAVDYRVAVDGLGLLMVLLTAIVTPMALLAAGKLGGTSSTSSPYSDKVRDGVEAVPPGSLYYALVLFLQAGLFGTFTALNFFHWFMFWELSLIPAFFLIRLWGGPQRAAASTQFFIYTMVGSIALLLSFLAMFLATKTNTAPGVFDFTVLGDMARNGSLSVALETNLGWKLFGHAFTAKQMAVVIFFGAFLGFAVKVPLIPFHTWLPGAYAEAPSATTMLLTGVMSKMGVYGFLRILLPIFPEQTRATLTPLLWLAVATIIFSAFAAFAQRDLKRMLAYSSINHLGYCLLAIFAVAKFTGNDVVLATEKAAALNGVFLQMFNHGITAATLFCFVGFLEQRSGGLRGVGDFGGLRKVVPVLCGLMGISVFASLGLPGLNGFVGEFLIFKGAFSLATWAAAPAALGLMATAVFLLTLVQRVFHGPLNEKWSGLPDLSLSERLIVLPAVALMFVIGLWPRLLLDFTNGIVTLMVEQLRL